MPQPNLLELAKQGDSHAIATLMNLTLEPKGVTATASLEKNCLRVFLNSDRALNAKTLVDFTQRGILSLGIQSIQEVQVYGQRTGEGQPSWVEAFTVHQSNNTNEQEDIATPSSIADLPQPLNDSATQIDTRLEQRGALKSQVQAYWGNALMASQQLSKRLQDWQKPSIRESISLLPARIRSVDYLKLSMVVTLVAFATGGTAAFIANSYAVGSLERKAGAKSAIAVNSNLTARSKAEGDRDQQQTEARKYLETMNQAQQTFYRQNHRLASNLEELERTAALPIISRSQYTYKLIIHNSNQSQLTAIPKADGLKSYTAVAALAKSTNQVVTAVCASQQPAKVPPLVFQSVNGAVQCPTESAKAS